jgi:hypothetical protein
VSPVSLVMTLISVGLKAYEYARERAIALKALALQSQNHQATEKVKQASSPEERKDAATQLSRSHSDILNS